MIRAAGALCAAALAGVAWAGKPGAPVKPGTLYVDAKAESDNLCPYTSTFAGSSDVFNLVFAKGAVLDDELNYRPDLLSEIPSLENGGVAKDGLTYVLKLKPGLKWQDGAPLTSEDLKFSYEGWRDFSQYTEPFEKIREITCPDRLTCVVKMKEVWAVMDRELIGSEILPKHLLSHLKTRADWIKSPFLRAPVGAGPFRFEKWESGSYVTLARNPHYHGVRPRMDRLIMKIIPDRNTRLTQLASGELDWYQEMEWPQYAKAKTIPGMHAEDRSIFMYSHVDFNMKRPLFQDKRLRHAVAHAIDREAISKALYDGRAPVAHTIVHPKLAWAYLADVPKYPFDLARAGKLLDEAGWKMGSGGVREKDGKALTFEICGAAESKLVSQTEVILQQTLKQAGIALEIRNYPSAVLFDHDVEKGILSGGKYDVAFYSWMLSDDPIGQQNVWKSDRIPPNGQNACFYSNPEIDAIFLAASKELSRPKRGALYRRLQALLMEDLPTVPMFYRPHTMAYKEQVEGIVGHPVGNQGPLWNGWAWGWRPTEAP